ncbi:hypothetical protein JL721_8299 [Aureococcus anophagefferens]|nr:hypothetical protein JL721_8299 [Aureococcus anophagefferens]
MDVYANGASTNPVRVELDGGHCGTMAAFEAAVSRAACGDPAACHVRDGAGRRVRKCSQLSRSSADFGVQPPGVARAYGVRRDMRFVFATEHVGGPGSSRSTGSCPGTTRTNSSRTRLAIDDDEHKLMQSSTGAKGYHVSSIRTSENAWVKDTATATKLKKKAFKMLGFDSYDEQMADGVQVLRYNNSNGYVAHKDFLSRPADVDARAMEPSLGGANRMATVFLYLTDVAQGGQTVFPKAERPANAAALPGVEARDVDDTIAALRDAMEVQTWEPKLVGQCYSKLAVRPARASAILFYSQRPDGTLDDYATHGGCPVLDGTKWAANLWVWNKAMPFGSSRFGDKGDGKSNDKNPQSVDVTFSTQLDAIEIFWKEVKMGDVEHGNAFTVK